MAEVTIRVIASRDVTVTAEYGDTDATLKEKALELVTVDDDADAVTCVILPPPDEDTPATRDELTDTPNPDEE